MGDGPALSIGEVINLLKSEFPDVTVSKVRFLESQGLIDPSRSPSGYRQFSSADVRRLRYILQQQRDHYLPLKVIKSQLTLWDRGDEPVMTAPAGPEPQELLDTGDGDTMDTEELLRRSGLARRHLGALNEHGVLRAVSENGSDRYGDRELAVAREAARLLAYGLEARHLRSVRIGAERHAEMLRHLTSALRQNRSPDAKRLAAETLAGGADALGKLAALMLAGEIRELLDT